MQYSMQNHTSGNDGNDKCCLMDVVQAILACRQCFGISQGCLCYIHSALLLLTGWSLHFFCRHHACMFTALSLLSCICLHRVACLFALLHLYQAHVQVAVNLNSTELLYSATKQTCSVRVDAVQYHSLTHVCWFSTFAVQESMPKTWCCTVTMHVISHQDPEGRYTQCYLTTLSVDRLTRPGYICCAWFQAVADEVYRYKL